MDNNYVTIKRAADILGVSTLTLRNWDKSGKFKAMRHPINNYRVYKMQDIKKLIDEIETAVFTKTGKKIKKLEIRHLED
jgi:site-specific DNA-methyltransferase (adenine-specific)